MSNDLELNKDRADAARYYGLFANKVGNFKAGEKILFIHIGNFDVLDRFIRSNKRCSYYIIDQYLNGPWFELNFKCNFIGSNEDDSIIKALEMLDMKFDKIIMNPPYSRNLHLKILAKAIEKLDENGTCVNLSPIRWLQDPLINLKANSDFKRFEESIRKHCLNIEVLPKLKAQEIFNGTVMGADLGIYTCGSIKTAYSFDYDSLKDQVALKVLNKKLSSPIFDTDKNNGWRVRIPIIANNGGAGNNRKESLAGFGKVLYFFNGKSKDGKLWYESYASNQYSKKYTELIQTSIAFNSEQEAKNFCESYHHQDMKTIFPAYVTSKLKCDVHVTPQIILWMGDAINPRTGKKGYESEWTDEDFYAYFGITEDEQKLIKETMEKYK